MDKKKIKVVVGLSGGVDSSVTTLLLKKAGYKVVAVFLTCWNKGAGCSAEQDRQDAVKVAGQIGIPIKIWNFEKEYQTKVIDRFYQEYQKGRTPNPDIWCNEEIKFGLFLEKALKELKADYIATGHYARIKAGNSTYHLLAGLDKSKDQSYFLYRLNQFQLSKVLFPLGELTKQKVRQIAKQNNLITANKRDSQGICFVGQVDLKEFLRRRIKFHPGKVVNSAGQVIGEHEGVEFYTIGQRHGFKLTKYQGAPLYVIKKDIKNNQLVVGRDKESEVEKFEVEDVHWISGGFLLGRSRSSSSSSAALIFSDSLQNGNLPVSKKAADSTNWGGLAGGVCDQAERSVLVRIRHLGRLVPCQIEPAGSNLLVYLSEPVRGAAFGQHAVFYKASNREVLGGGVIKS